MAARAGYEVAKSSPNAQSTTAPTASAPPYFAPMNNGYTATAGLIKKQSG